jgi:GNAT superfamily N-acetyltransferase
MTAADLLARIPDSPRWVEGRAMLLRGEAEVIGTDPEACVIQGRDLARLVGVPDEALLAALRTPEALADFEHSGEILRRMRDWGATEAVLHRLPSKARLPGEGPAEVRMLGGADAIDLRHVNARLRLELRQALRFSPVFATWVGGLAVSFAYGVETETLFDVSVDTLTPYRGRGFASAAVAALIRHHQGRGKSPVWGAVMDNAASLQLARKLGFVECDRLMVLERRAGGRGQHAG